MLENSFNELFRLQEELLNVLKENGPLKTSELAWKVGKKKAKDVQNVLNKLHKRKIITKSKINTKLQWAILENNEETNQVKMEY